MSASRTRIKVHELEELSATELLDQDQRPTFILDLKVGVEPSDPTKCDFTPVFYNRALKDQHRLYTTISRLAQHPKLSSLELRDNAGFLTWTHSANPANSINLHHGTTHSCFGMLWTAYVLRDRWKVVSTNSLLPSSNERDVTNSSDLSATTVGVAPRSFTANEETNVDRFDLDEVGQLISTDQSQPTASESDESAYGQSLQTALGRLTSLASSNGRSKIDPKLALSTTERGVPDCTAEKPIGILSAHLILFRSRNWAATPLGAMETWSKEFRQVVNLVMGNPHPAALFWGNELSMLYNEAYAAEVAGNKHPALLGTGFAGPFHEIWEGVRPLFAECARTGTSIRKDNNVLFMERRGFIEETYFSWSFTPLYGSGSKILGFYNAPFETTAYCVGQRRTQTLQRLNQSIGTAKTVADFWQCVLGALEGNPFDIPFVLLYSVEHSSDTASNGEQNQTQPMGQTSRFCTLEGSIGIPLNHSAAPQKIDLESNDHGWTLPFRDAMQTKEPIKLQVSDGTLPESLLSGLDWRGFGDACKEAVILPLQPTNSDAILSFLLLGNNPRRRFDDEYKAFTTLMNRQLATSLASIMLFEEETRRSKIAIEAATLEQEQLNERLAVQSDRLLRMTALSPLGMFYIDPQGLILEANDRYFEMTSQNRDELFEMCWLDQLMEESKGIMMKGWRQMTVELRPFSAELRLNKKCIDVTNPKAEPIDYWVLTNSYPELTADGKLRSIMGSITDISHLKWAQGLQDIRLREAEETRRQQNEFIDITSHEMRNPMSAVLQCADDIAKSLTAHRDNVADAAGSVVDDCIELANTITLCVQHQKTIVDDILTVSKLDSNLVTFTPTPVQPVQVIRRIVKLFEPEFVSKAIDFNLVLHPSFGTLDFGWMLMDPSRISQIVINFMTNAIKFTSGRKERRISMHLGASNAPPVPTTPNFEYIPRKNMKQSSFLEGESEPGDTVYLRVKVEDTGCGLSEDEKQLLFQRFQQASPRTHAQYGGSGLGLFISRQLTELHGGQIGVASIANVGSTFGFFVKAKRAVQPESQLVESPNEWEQSWLGGHRKEDSAVVSSVALDTEAAGDMAPSVGTPSLPLRNGSTAIAAPLALLVVEDNLVNQRVLTKQLRKAGCDVVVAGNGKLALDLLQTTSFWHTANDGARLTAVLMDLEMPIMDGLTCVREIRRLEAEGSFIRHVPVIAITANVRREQIDAAKASGMDDVVSKPFRISDILAKINALLQRLEAQTNKD